MMTQMDEMQAAKKNRKRADGALGTDPDPNAASATPRLVQDGRLKVWISELQIQSRKTNKKKFFFFLNHTQDVNQEHESICGVQKSRLLLGEAETQRSAAAVRGRSFWKVLVQ